MQTSSPIPLSPFLQVYFQPSAWADEQFVKDWFKQFQLDTADLQGWKLLGMDCHGAQQTNGMRARYKAGKVQPAFTPPDCTDCVSPCDYNIPAHLKGLIGQLFMAEFHDGDWTDSRLTASKRRMKMARWVSQAWQELQTKGPNYFQNIFEKTGFLFSLDGSDDAKIMSHKCPGYTF